MARQLTGALLAVVLACSLSSAASAQSLFSAIGDLFSTGDAQANATEMRATIWVDPDGCEHWVMDTGIEGFMSAHLDRNGKPVCRAAVAQDGVCKTLDGAALFDSGSAKVKTDMIEELLAYFRTVSGRKIVINGHTDDRGSAQANLDLSLRRAVAVAEIAEQAGVIAEPRGYGEQVPIAPNSTAEGRASNRRVELTCS